MGRQGCGVEERQGSIRLYYSLDGRQRKHTLKVDGRPLQPTPANLRYAHRIADEITLKLRLGTFNPADYFDADTTGESTTVGAQLDTWLAAQRIETSTRAGYESAIKFWKAAPYQANSDLKLGDLELRLLLPSHVAHAHASRKLSGKTLNNYASVLREAMDLAVADRRLHSNPAGIIKRVAHQKDPPDPFDLAEVSAIIADALKHYPEPIGNHIQWRFFSGVRTSEAAGLRWPSVDLAAGYFRVHEVIVRGMEKAKTKTSVARDVRLNDESRAALLRQAKHTRMAGEHVWLDPRYGTPWLEERAFRRSYWTPILKRLGIRYRPPNQMRHSFATLMLMAGRKPAWCAGQMGHSVEMFLRTYARWIKGAADDQEVDGLNAYLSLNYPRQSQE